jgi:hypothetical protein
MDSPPIEETVETNRLGGAGFGLPSGCSPSIRLRGASETDEDAVGLSGNPEGRSSGTARDEAVASLAGGVPGLERADRPPRVPICLIPHPPRGFCMPFFSTSSPTKRNKRSLSFSFLFGPSPVSFMLWLRLIVTGVLSPMSSPSDGAIAADPALPISTESSPSASIARVFCLSSTCMPMSRANRSPSSSRGGAD